MKRKGPSAAFRKYAVAVCCVLLTFSQAHGQDSSSPDAVSAATSAAEPVLPQPSPDAVSAATQNGGPVIQPNFLGKHITVNSHRLSGYTAGGLLAAAGVIGGIRFLEMEFRAHESRTGEEEFSSSCQGIVTDVWYGNQWLRWTHVGLLAAGESLYLYDGITGLSILPPKGSGTMAGKIHRTAFFIHAGLMAGEIGLGLLMSDALKRGAHEEMRFYGTVHTGIGIAIPVIIIGSGLFIDLFPDLKF